MGGIVSIESSKESKIVEYVLSDDFSIVVEDDKIIKFRETPEKDYFKPKSFFRIYCRFYF